MNRRCAVPKEHGWLERKVRLSDWRAPSTGLKEWIDHVSTWPVPVKEQAAQLARLEAFRELQRGWDSYGAEPPSETALTNAKRILRILWEYEGGSRIRLSPSVEGGVGIIFTGSGNKYADIECFNDGEILAITSEGTPEPSVWAVDASADSFRSAIERITTFLNG